MSKEFIISLVCIFLLVVGGAAKIGYDQHKLAEERWQADAHKLAILESRDRAHAQIKKIAGVRADDARTAGLSSADDKSQKPAGGAGGAKPAAAATPAVAAADDSAIRDFAARAKISSVLLGSPKIVVIDKHEYEEGSEIALPGGRHGHISEIAEEGVTLNYEGRSYHIVAWRQAPEKGRPGKK